MDKQERIREKQADALSFCKGKTSNSIALNLQNPITGLDRNMNEVLSFRHS